MKLKHLLTLASLLIGGGNLWAQETVPFLSEKSDFGGTTVSSLSTFRPSGTTYTLELTGCTAGTEITVPGGSFSYTPTASGTVRFVRVGDNVYVYEDTSYKGTVTASTPADPTYPTGLTSASTENLIQNGGFEDNSTLYSGQTNRWLPVNWNIYNSSKADPGNGPTVRDGSKTVGEYNQEIEGETNVEIIPVSA